MLLTQDYVPEDLLDQFARQNGASGFIRQMMRRMFTFQYLTSETYSTMDILHWNTIKGFILIL